MMDKISPKQQLEALKHRYVQGLPDRMDEISASWARLQHVSWDPKALAFMDQCAHKLVGSGATFQFPDISEKARLLEKHLQVLLTKSDADPAERKQIDDAVTALSKTIELATKADTDREPLNAEVEYEQPLNAQYGIAVIEDDPNQAELLKAWLQRLGYAAEMFEDPDAYNARAADYNHHLILLDISFPEGALEGIALLERLKSQAGYNTPVIMMSARTDMVARMRALRAGADSYLTKPLDLDFLEKRLEQLLGDKTSIHPRVLWVDDDKDLLAYYKTTLMAEGYNVDCLSQPVRILERIEEFHPDAIVLDHDMPGCQGAELARALRQDANYMTIPILFVSASTDVSAQLEQHSIAGNSYFQKPLDTEPFLRALKQHIEKAKMVASRIKQVSQRKEESGLQNRDYFITELGALLANTDTRPTDCSRYLVQVSIDREEYLKARHGARALISLSARMERYFSNQLTAEDSGCLIGDSSFLFQLNAPAGSDRDDEAFIDTFYHQMGEQAWALGDDATPITLSMGVLPLNYTRDEDTALMEVESAWASAMQSGGNQVKWQQPPEPTTEAELDLRMQELIAARAYTLYYQPIVNMETSDTLFEALVRLVDEDHSIYLPAQFMQLMRSGDKGAFYELDRWVIEHAVEELSHLEGKSSASHSVIIKLSSVMSDLENLIPFISNTIRNSRIKGKRRFFFALSNPILLRDVPRAKRIVKALREMNCGVIVEHVDLNSAAVDLIKELEHVDFVKLIPGLGARTELKAPLDQLIRQLGAAFSSSLPIIVAGVEDTKALSWFWERGIRNFQGHFIQKPEVAMTYDAVGQ
ncbi:response regulator [Marinobacter sp. V034]|uniref:response regulator n=1 Tax=Marinobacter sp. V034 TaxID=3459610 RepID=UPI004044052D